MTARIVNQQCSLNQLLDLLKASKLPYQDIRLESGTFITYHDKDGKLLGSGGLEFCPLCALLRSVAVIESERGKSIGKEIIQDLLDRAKKNSAKAVYLLTETAHQYFLKHGFVDTNRESVPDAFKKSSEFKSVCPASANCMVYKF